MRGAAGHRRERLCVRLPRLWPEPGPPVRRGHVSGCPGGPPLAARQRVFRRPCDRLRRIARRRRRQRVGPAGTAGRAGPAKHLYQHPGCRFGVVPLAAGALARYPQIQYPGQTPAPQAAPAGHAQPGRRAESGFITAKGISPPPIRPSCSGNSKATTTTCSSTPGGSSPASRSSSKWSSGTKDSPARFLRNQQLLHPQYLTAL